jgi:ABC-type branched-subunit amino acid transport system substrate-binding protein
MSPTLNTPRSARRPRRARTAALAAAAALALAGCDPAMMAGTGGGGAVTRGCGVQIDPAAPVRVGLLVPGSSGGAEIATLSQNLENAARLAAADLQGAQVEIGVYPTGGTGGGAQRAAQQAIGEGAQILLGPLFAEAANGASIGAASSNLCVLAFSNNTTVAQNSPNLFILGNTFDNVARRLTSYAASQGKRNVLVVSAQSAAERAGAEAIARAAANSRLTIAGNLTFPLTEAGVRNVAPQIVRQVQASGADAIFFTSDNAGAMGFLPQYLREAGLSSDVAQYIGLARLDLGPGALAAPGIQGAWFALPDPTLNTNFRNRYQQAYGSQPHPLAGLGYDGIAAIGALVANGRSDALTARALTSGGGFVGVGGIFRLRPDGTNQRGLAVAQIQNQRVVVIDSAPRSFGGAGF